jgi:hypothetical protein
MKKFLSIFSFLTLSLWPRFFCQAANLGDAFKGNFLDKVAGVDGAGYDTSKRSIDPIIGNVILVITSLMGVVFLILMIYSGIMWMTAAGDDGRVTKAKNTMQAAVIGLIVVVAAYMITYFVFVRFAQPALTI